jgi:hypothetical protein
MAKRKVKVGELIVDPKLTELRPINLVFVSRYRQAYRTGAVLPPLIVEEGTNRVVSGNHRLQALLAEYGPDKEVAVSCKKFSGELEVLKEFARENAAHGNPMDGITRKRIAAALLDMGAPVEEVSNLFNVPVRSLEKWGEHFVGVVGEDGTQRLVPVKRGLNLAPGITLTERLYEEHKRKDRGVTAFELVDQLLRWLKNGWMEPTDDVVASLTELRSEIGKLLKKAAKVA